MSPREIDIQVAIHVTRWQRLTHLPLYSTDPAASKQLKDKLWAEGWRWVVQALSNDRYVARFWRVRLEDEGNDETSTFVEGEAYDDAELMAVALAALSAVGKTVKQ